MSESGTMESGLLEDFRLESASRRTNWMRSTMARWLRDHKAIFVFISLIVGGLVLNTLPERWLTWEWVRSLKRTLSDALIVAGLLGLTVDSFLKRALIRDVGAIFIGWALPQEIRDHIREVSQTSIVRRNFRVCFNLAVDGNSARVQVTTEVDVYNFSASPQKYFPVLSLDLHDNPDESETKCEWRVGSRDYSWNAAKFVETRRVERNHDVITWRLKPIVLQPQDVGDPRIKPACKTRWTHVEKMPVPYTDFVAFTYPTIDTEVTAHCPSEIEFTADSPTSHAEGSNQWSYRRLYMPGQSIRVRWRRVQEGHQADPPQPSNRSSGSE